MQALPVKTHLGEGFRARVGDENVSLGEKLHHDLEALFALEVQCDETLVEVGHVEREVFLVAGRHAENDGLIGAAGVAFECFYLDNVCAPFAKYATGGRGGEKRGEVNDLQTLEWQHCFLLGIRHVPECL